MMRPPVKGDSSSSRHARTRQRRAERPWCFERERDGHGSQPDAGRADEQPDVAAEHVVQPPAGPWPQRRSEELTTELQSPYDLVCGLVLEKKKSNKAPTQPTQ